jgi:hypothetical protein
MVIRATRVQGSSHAKTRCAVASCAAPRAFVRTPCVAIFVFIEPQRGTVRVSAASR